MLAAAERSVAAAGASCGSGLLATLAAAIVDDAPQQNAIALCSDYEDNICSGRAPRERSRSLLARTESHPSERHGATRRRLGLRPRIPASSGPL